jgi:hypothetical protein
MKKMLYTIAIFVFILSITSPAAAQDEPPTPNWLNGDDLAVFLPIVVRAVPTHIVTGQIKDAQDLPLGGVSVSSTFGNSGVTDAYGVYRLTTQQGIQEIVAAKDGYNFEPGVADLDVTEGINNLNFTGISTSEGTLQGCTNLLYNPNFESNMFDGWTISPANNPSNYTMDYFFSPVWSMESGVPLWASNPFPYQFTTGEFWQPTIIPIPWNATVVNLRMRLLPTSSDLWGYHVWEQAAMDASSKLNAPDETESQYGHIRDAANTVTLRQLFKWFPIDSRYWLYRSYDLREFRGQTISVLFGAANDGWNGNTALYVDDVYLYYCVP